MKMTRKEKIVLITVFIISTGFFAYTFASFKESNDRAVLTEYQRYAENYEYQLNNIFNEAIEPAKYISFLIKKEKGTIDCFEELCKENIASTVTQAIQLVPNGIVTESYPLAGNEAAIGVNNFEDEIKAPYALEAKANKMPVITPPIVLKQGSEGILCFYPVFYTDETGKECFYGFVTTIINVNRLYKALALENLEGIGIRYGIYYVNEKAGKEILMWENQADRIKIPVYTESVFLNARWYIVLDATNGIRKEGYGFKVCFLVFVCTGGCWILLVLKKQKDALNILANVDALTGAFNRRCFENQVIEKRIADRQPFVFFYMDLDKFKGINDTYGHDAGDFILKTMVERFKDTLGEQGEVARIGGDEFAAITDENSVYQNPQRKAEDIMEAAAKECRYHGQVLECKVSVGISRFPEDGDTLCALLLKADAAMYTNKRQI